MGEEDRVEREDEDEDKYVLEGENNTGEEEGTKIEGQNKDAKEEDKVDADP